MAPVCGQQPLTRNRDVAGYLRCRQAKQVTDLPAAAPQVAVRTRQPGDSRKSTRLSIASRGAYLLACALLLVGFFLPWLRIGELAQVSGLTLTLSDNVAYRGTLTGGHRALLWLLPALTVALAACAAKGWRSTHLLALLTGLFVVGYALSIVAVLFLSSTAVGLWLMVGGTLALLGLPLLIYRQA